MIHDVDTFLGHLKRTGRIKLLPSVLRELQATALREKKMGERTETAKDNPELISGTRTLKNGFLTDTTGKRALLEMYQRITKS